MDQQMMNEILEMNMRQKETITRHSANNIDLLMRANVNAPRPKLPKIKGIAYNHSTAKYTANLYIGFTVHLGTFNNLADAKKARLDKAIEIFGIDYIPECKYL